MRVTHMSKSWNMPDKRCELLELKADTPEEETVLNELWELMKSGTPDCLLTIKRQANTTHFVPSGKDKPHVAITSTGD